MTVDELMRPRFKVVEDYPYSEYEVGLIIEFEEEKCTYYTGQPEWETVPIKYKDGGGWLKCCIKKFEPYPRIFKPMEWWEERKAEDMPRYVISKHTSVCYMVDEYNDLQLQEDGCLFMVNNKYYSCSYFLPTTEEGYNNFINKQKQ